MPRLFIKKRKTIQTYKPSFMDIIASQQNDVKEAKKRVKIERGKYYYQPSPEYMRFISKFAKK